MASGIGETALGQLKIVRKGFEPAAVKAVIADLSERVATLSGRVAELEAELSKTQELLAQPPKLDEATLTAALGAETAAVLGTARSAAADIRLAAEQEAARKLEDARAEADLLLAQARSAHEDKTRSAELAAREIQLATEAKVEALLQAAHHDAEVIVVAARQQGQQVLREAQETRTNVLGDMTRRRRVLAGQLEALRAGKDSLLDSLRVARSSLDRIDEGLARAELDARSAADLSRPPTDPGSIRRSDAPHAEGGPVESREGGDSHADPGPPPTGGDGQGVVGVAPAEGVPEAQQGPAGAVGGDQALSSEAAEPGIAESPEHPVPPLSDPGGGADPQLETEPVSESLPSPEESEDHQNEMVAEGPGILGPPPAEVAVQGEAMVEDEAMVEEVVVQARVEPDGGVVTAPEAAPLPESEPVSGIAARLPPAPAEPGVDDLFERIRRGREVEVERARKTLSPTPRAGRGRPARSPAALTHAPLADPAANESALQKRDLALDPVISSLSKKLKRALQDEQNILLDRLRAHSGPGFDVLPALEEQKERYEAIATDPLQAAWRAGVGYVSGATEVTEGSECVTHEARSLAGALALGIRGRVEPALDRLESAQEIATLIGAVFREWKGPRLENLAAYHAVATFSQGLIAATSDGMALRWIADDGESTCSDCRQNELIGGVAPGANYPTGSPYPPVHVGCRCLLEPVLT